MRRRTKNALVPACLLAVTAVVSSLGGVATEDTSSSVTLTPSFDGHVVAGQPSTSFTTQSTLLVDGQPEMRTYVGFDAADVSGDVTKATLRMYVTDGSSDGPLLYDTSYSALDGSLTWNTQSGPRGSALRDLGSVTAGGYVSIDVTSQVQVDSDGRVAFVFVPGSSDGVDFSSADASSNLPQLVLETAPSGAPAPSPAPDSSGCPSFATSSELGSVGFLINNGTRMELSGLAASRKNAGVLWTHNDSGDMRRVFAMTESGRLLGEYRTESISQTDWEDVAVGPGPVAGAQYVYAGDIGGNAGRSTLRVYRFPEPTVSTSQARITTTVSGTTTLTVTYPAGREHDAESMFVDRNGDIFIVTKRGGNGESIVYRAPFPQPANSTLQEVGKFTVTGADHRERATTGGAISADGSTIVVRTYTKALVWKRASGASIGQTLSAAPCRTVRLRDEAQGEAVTLRGNGDMLTVSEGNYKEIWRYAAG